MLMCLLVIEVWLSVQVLLPNEFSYCICHLDVDESGFTAARGTIRVNCHTVDDAKDWLDKFQRKTKMTFRVLCTRAVSGERILHNVR